MASERTGTALPQRRREHGLGQGELARAAGISRQALSAIEAGRAVPSTLVALRLARALGCSVEALFWLEDEGEVVDVRLPRGASKHGRVRVAHVGGDWVAHPIGLSDVADGELVDGSRARLFEGSRSLSDRLLVAGCDPALGLLARAAERARVAVAWLDQTSARALRSLADREVHAAGAHLYDAASGEHNLPFVRRWVPGSCVAIELASTEEGLVAAPGNPHAIRGIEDLARDDVRSVNRPAGSAARELLDRELARAGVPTARVSGYARTVASHEEVARAVLEGSADAGIATRAVAIAHGLAFVPLQEERFDLVVPAALIDTPVLERLLAILSGAAFRRQLGAIGGYDTRGTGREVGRT